MSLRELIKEQKRTIFEVITKSRVRKTDKKSYAVKIFLCACPNSGCTNTVSISKKSDLDHQCRICAVKGRKKSSQDYTKGTVLS